MGTDAAHANCGAELTPQFWDEIWSAHREASGFYRDSADEVEFWNRRARQFCRNTTGDAGAGRVREVLEWLHGRGVRTAAATVLDVGSGPGSFAVPFAETGAHVTAIDASPEMITLLHEQMDEAGVHEYTALAERWEDLDPGEHGWEKAFDLVFISMCPAVSNRATLEKALACSQAFVYLTAFAGKRESRALVEIWDRLEQSPPPGVPDDSFYIANLLYTLGYSFESSVFTSSYTEEMTTDEALALLTRTVLRREPQSSQAEVEAAVRDYVSEHCRNGMLCNQVDNRHGRFLVRV